MMNRPNYRNLEVMKIANDCYSVPTESEGSTLLVSACA